MKNKHLLIVAVSIVILSSCKKEDTQIRGVDRPITISAQVPQKVYTNKLDLRLDARSTLTSNGKRTLNFLWSCPTFPAGHPPVISNPSEAVTKVDSLRRGTYLFTLKVWDAAGNVALSDFPLEVLQDTLHDAPKINPLSDIKLQLPQCTASLNGSQNYQVNPQGRVLFFHWSVIQVPVNSTPIKMSDTAGAVLNVILNAPGHYRFRLELSNDLHLSSADTIDIEVLPDALSGTERIYDNVSWKVEDDGWGGIYAGLFLSDPDIYQGRSSASYIISFWSEGKQQYIPAVNFAWSGGSTGLLIYTYENPYPFAGLTARVKVKIL
jgi:hypothetical protein